MQFDHVPFEYPEAQTIEEAKNLLSTYTGRARVLAGGTDLLMRLPVLKPEYLIDISRISELNYIEFDEDDGLRIGALTPISTLAKSETIQQRFPMITQAVIQFSTGAISNSATIGGNICNASPVAETAPALLALGATAKIDGPSGERDVPLEEFFLSPGKTVVGADELLLELHLPVPPDDLRSVYLKYCIRMSIDLATVGVAAALRIDPHGVCQEARIVLGAVAPTPMRAREAEALLTGYKIDDSLVDRCGEVASGEAQPITDHRGTAENRREMVKVFTRRAIRQALAA